MLEQLPTLFPQPPSQVLCLSLHESPSTHPLQRLGGSLTTLCLRNLRGSSSGLTAESIQKLTSLSVLDLGDGDLWQLPPGLFQTLTNLTNLRLDNQPKITTIPLGMSGVVDISLAMAHFHDVPTCGHVDGVALACDMRTISAGAGDAKKEEGI